VAALVAAAGGGVAIAASDSSPSQENKTILDSVAKQLGISSSKLSDALKRALGERVDAAVAAGRLSKEEGDALKDRIDSGKLPLFGGAHGRGFDHVGFIGKLDAAADYLGLTEAQLRTQLESGKSLAQIAQAEGKSADGLIDALVNEAKKHVDEAVSAGRLTRAQADEMLKNLRERITSGVSSTGLGRPHLAPRGFRNFGFHRHSERPPA
jgi:polyhydroxyalkanoate synthesis regulator phasin